MARWANLSLRSQLIVPILVGGAIVAAAVIVVMSSVRNRTVEQAGVNTAGAVAAQIASLRGFYTEQIVTRARSAGMDISHDFADQDKTLPLPATMVKALGQSLAADNAGMSVRLYSRFPFPFRAQSERYDDFERQALAALEREPTKPFWAIETVDGRKSVRYAVADTMKESCIGCHNSHAQSPKKDWKSGDVRGAIAVTVPVDVVGAQIENGMRNLGLAVLAGIGLIALAALAISSRVGKSASSLCASLETAARDNDFTAKIDISAGAELGRIGRSVAGLMQSCGDSFRALAGNARAISAAVEKVAHSSAQIETSSHAQSDSTASTAAAVEELTVSINHIADNTHETRAMTEQASAASHTGRSAARQASEEMERIAQTVCDSASMITGLSQRSSEINNIAAVIKGIAEQTNLLALNAAIEAARAGDHGRGFAVVADEVRKLAERTGTATTQIESMIGSIQQEIALAVVRLQDGSKQAAEGVRGATEVAAILDRIEHDARETLARVGEVASAAGEQGAAANDIARNIERIAQMTERNMREVGETTASVRHLQVSIREFETEMARFKY